MIGINTASAFLALLDETEPELHYYALQKLNDLVGEFWAEIATSIEKIEILYEDESFPHRQLAALVASKVFYHLGEFSDAMTYALGAGELFDIQSRSEYVDTLVSICFDEYIKQRSSGDFSKVDPRLESIVELMFTRCFTNGGFKEGLGIAIEARRMDKIKEAILGSSDSQAMLEYCMNTCLLHVSVRDYRHQIFALLVELYHTLDHPDYLTVCRILVFLDDALQTAEILVKLLNSSQLDDHLLAYQIAFDLVSNGTQQFLKRVRDFLPAKREVEDDDATEGPTAMETDDNKPKEGDFDSRLAQTQKILSGTVTTKLFLEFLHRNNHSDLVILKNTKNALDARQSVTHSALIFANALMNAGTTRDAFLRENLEWLARATNWAKFSATAGLGVIHKGHLEKGLALLDPYLPKPNNHGSSPYSEGGALYALGLIHANHGEGILQYLRDALANAQRIQTSDSLQKTVIQHGACLGLGVAGMATGNSDIYGDLMKVLKENDASAGEAAGLAMGLVMLGTADETSIRDMREHAKKTQHEKIIRGLAIGIAMVMYGREEQADPVIDELISNTDPIMRYGAMFTVAMAYCGTANNSAIRKLLHMAVSDVSDDVRRAAVMSLGFLLSAQPEQCPKMVSLLAESYNPHVRYGATLAVGIACAGTAMPEAIDLLLPMTSDSEAFVRQGALIGLALVLIQTTKAQEPRVEKVRKLFEEKLTTKGEPVMTKFGATLAQGIIDAGGRNCTISIHSLSGHMNLSATVGLAIFTQYWYWYPLTHFLCLAFTPTTMICLNKDLKLPQFQFSSYCKPSLFAYPAKIKPPTTVAPTKVATAILSTTRKAKALAQKKEEIRKSTALPVNDSMDVDPKPDEKKDQPEAPEPEEKKEPAKKKKKEEPKFEIKSNPCRVPLGQLKYLACDVDKRYCPVRFTNKGDLFGIVVLKDLLPGEPEIFVEVEEKKEGSQPEASN